MSFTGKWYGQAKKHAFTKRIDWVNDDIRVVLLGSGYSPNQDAHEFLSQVAAHEVSGVGYEAGGEALTGKSITYDATNNRVKFHAGTLRWYPVTVEARYGVIYNNTGAEKVLIGYLDFGTARAIEDGVFEIQWHADGVMWIQAD